MATRRGVYRSDNDNNHCAVPGCKYDAPGHHMCAGCGRPVHSVCMDETFGEEGPPWLCGGNRCLAVKDCRKSQSPRPVRAAAPRPQHVDGDGEQQEQDSPVLPQSQQGVDAVDALVGLRKSLNETGGLTDGCAAGQLCTKAGLPALTTTSCCGRPCHGICAPLCAECVPGE